MPVNKKPQSFDPSNWIEDPTAEPELLEALEELFQRATTYCDCFQFQGHVFDKAATLAHWGNKPNVFTKGMRTLKDLQQQQQLDEPNKPVALFYFPELYQGDDGDPTDVPWTARLGDYVTIDQAVEVGKKDLIIGRVVEIILTANGHRRVGVIWMYRVQDSDLAGAIKQSGKTANKAKAAGDAEEAEEAGEAGEAGGEQQAEEEAEEAQQEEDDKVDPNLAAAVELAAKSGRRSQAELDHVLQRLLVDGDSSEVFPGRLWLCGSEVDNRRYCTYYDIGELYELASVKFVRPGCNTLEQVMREYPDFNPAVDYYYNGYTVKDYLSFEDIHQDFTPWSQLYKQVWEKYGVEGVKTLRGELSLDDPDGGYKRLMSFSRGAPQLPFKLDYAAAGAGSSDAAIAARQQEGGRRVLQKLELFAGGGGLSHMAQELERCGAIVSVWANDINPSACATYVANKPNTMVSCCGLEEYSQLLKKFASACDTFLGPDWQQLSELQVLLQLPPGKRYSRPHMPQGVGCSGGEHPDDYAAFTYSASEGQKARAKAEADLLPLVSKTVAQVRQQLVKRQSSVDKAPVSMEYAAWVLQQAQHLQDYKRAQQEKERDLPVPDFDACCEALLDVQLVPADFDSSSGSVEERAVRLLEVVLPQDAPEELLTAVPEPPQQQPLADDATAEEKRQHKKEQEQLEELLKKAELQQEAELEAYGEAWKQQKEVVEEHLARQEELQLGAVEEVRDVRIRDCAVRVTSGSSSRQMQGALTPYQCWLEYEVRRQGSAEWFWEHEALMHLDDAIPAMRDFILRMVADKTIPLPGDVDIMTGGPPCQNMTGLNRQARQEAVLEDPKNRLVACYMNTIDFLQPPYLLIEQVTDIWRKQQGVYVRFSITTMLTHGYQARVGNLTAGNYGAPQGRERVIIWGALSGSEQLPPFPAPTHECKDYGLAHPTNARHCVVDPLPAGTMVGGLKVPELLPFQVWGDVGSDLPKVDNFSETESLAYKSAPVTFLQQWLRRDPPSTELPLLLRAVHADAAMALWGPLFDEEVVASALAGQDPDTVVAAGMLALCQTCKWLGKQTTAQARKLAATFGKLDALPAAAAADQGEAGEAEDQEDEEDVQGGGDDEPGEVQDEDEEDAKALRKEMQGERDFTTKVQRRHLASSGDPDRAEEILLMAQTQQDAITQMTGVRCLKEMQKSFKTKGIRGPLRDHRPHQCNLDDVLRMEALPKNDGLGVCFRDLPGVVTNADKTTCNGCWHAAQVPATAKDVEVRKQRVAQYRDMVKSGEAKKKKINAMDYVHKGVALKSACQGGGNLPRPPERLHGKDGNDTQYRVEAYGTREEGHTSKEGCKSRTFFMASNGLLCPRWCVTSKSSNGGGIGRHACYGVLHPDSIQTTVVSRSEPHNLELVVDGQGRVFSVRENARCQAFPDYHVFVGLGVGSKFGSGKGVRTLTERYLQVGNAVAPAMAAALGRCLLLAAAKKAPVAEPVIPTPDPDWAAAVEEGDGTCHWYSKEYKLSKEYPDYWVRHPAVMDAGKKRKQAAAADTQGDAAAPDQDAVAAAAGAPAPKRRKVTGTGSGSSNSAQQQAAAGAAAAAAAAGGDGDSGAAGRSKASSKARSRSGVQEQAAAGAAAAGGDSAAAAARSGAGSKARNRSGAQQQATAGGAAAAAAAGDTDGAAAAAAAAGGAGDAAAAVGRSRASSKARSRSGAQQQAAAGAAAAAAAAATAGGDGDGAAAAARSGAGSKARSRSRAQQQSAAAAAAAVAAAAGGDGDSAAAAARSGAGSKAKKRKAPAAAAAGADDEAAVGPDVQQAPAAARKRRKQQDAGSAAAAAAAADGDDTAAAPDINDAAAAAAADGDNAAAVRSPRHKHKKGLEQQQQQAPAVA